MQPKIPQVRQPHTISDQQRFELLIDSLTDYAIYMLDTDGFITSWNTGAEKLTGYAAGETIGKHFSHFFGPEDQANSVPKRVLKEAAEFGRSEYEGWRIRKDGTRLWTLAVLQPVRNRSGQLIGFAKVIRDITERAQRQAKLLESESRFRLLVEGVIDYAIYMLDPSGIVSNWNKGAQRMKGYSANEIIGQHFSRFYTKEDRDSGLPMRILERALKDGRFEGEGWRVRKDGTRFWASIVIDPIRQENGDLLGFAKVTRDITERQAAHEALRESERQFRLLVDSVTDYALYMLDPHGIVTNWNTGAQRIKGYTANEIIGQHFSRFYPDHDRLAGLPARALETAAREGRYEAEGWRVRKDGSVFWANVIIDPIHDENKNLVGFAKITRDITEKRNIQLATEEAKTQRDYAQKMDVLGQLTGGVAHDFNNLLMIIGGNLWTLKKLMADNPQGLHATESIDIATKRGASLTRQLLTFSRRQALNPVAVNLGERLNAFRPLLESSIGATAQLSVTSPPNLWPVKIDLSEFELALVNLTLNSRDAMPQGGTILVTAANEHLRREDTPLKLEGDYVAVTVSDSGTGIAPELLSKVFEPFFTTKPPDKGTGLGLSQVHGFAHQSGGTVTIKSQPGNGTAITIYLPRSDDTPEKDSDLRGDESVAGGKVLLVEDNHDVAQVSTQMLEELGYVVESVTSGEAALAAVERQKFDLVVSDIVMAGPINGLSAARALRQHHPNLPILLITGYGGEDKFDQAEFPLLRKPFRYKDLSSAITNAIADVSSDGSTLV
jgi:PAS domain S-box-containing protein